MILLIAFQVFLQLFMFLEAILYFNCGKNTFMFLVANNILKKGIQWKVKIVCRDLPGNSSAGISHDDPSSLIPMAGQGIPVQRTSSVLATKGSFKRNRKSDNETKDETLAQESGSKLHDRAR